MLEPAIPADEAQRLVDLCRLRVLDSGPEARFDRITRTAMHLFGAPMALVTLVDAGRQWFKSRQGLDVASTPRRISFCGQAVLQEGTFVVADAKTDARFADNPLVTGPPHVRFYVGMPLHGPGGFRVLVEVVRAMLEGSADTQHAGTLAHARVLLSERSYDTEQP